MPRFHLTARSTNLVASDESERASFTGVRQCCGMPERRGGKTRCHGTARDDLHSADRDVRGTEWNFDQWLAESVPEPGELPDVPGNMSYNSLNVSLVKRATRGLSFKANYTFSKALDFNSAVSSSGGTNQPKSILNPYNLSLSRGLAAFNLKHQFNANYAYQLPFGRGQRFAGNAGGSTGSSAVGNGTESSPPKADSRLLHRLVRTVPAPATRIIPTCRITIRRSRDRSFGAWMDSRKPADISIPELSYRPRPEHSAIWRADPSSGRL